MFAVAGWLIRPDHRTADIRGAVTGLLYVANLDRYTGFSDGGMFGHLWSLSLEEQFYAIWPVVFVLLTRRRNQQQLGLITAAVSVALFIGVATRAVWWFDVDRIYNGIEGQGMAFLLAGCAWGALDPSGAWLRHATPVWATAGLLIVAATFNYQAPATYVAMPLIAAGMLAVVSGALGGGPLQPYLSLPPLRRIGQWSYGIYLIHSPVRILLSAALESRYPHGHRISAASLVITFALAAASFRWLERPMRVRLSGPRPVNHTAVPPKDPRSERTLQGLGTRR